MIFPQTTNNKKKIKFSLKLYLSVFTPNYPTRLKQFSRKSENQLGVGKIYIFIINTAQKGENFMKNKKIK